MKTSIATVSISGNFEEKLEAIAAAGFHGLEIFEQDFIAHDANPREVGEMIRAMGLEITIFQPFRDFEGLPDPLRAKAFDRAEHKFDRCCQTNENSHRIACAALIYALNSWRHSVRAAVRLNLKLSRE